MKISEKLSGINMKFNRERSMKLDHLENKLRNLDNRFLHFKENSISRQNQVREHIAKLQRQMEGEHSTRNQMMDTKVKEMIEIEQKYSYLIEQEIKVKRL